jgi:murein DD-endopeptidase MepM/ murein hydrolase activator NlpD
VDIDHGGGWTTRYAHMSVVYVQPGQSVDASTVIGLVGNTGNSRGPVDGGAHLHFEQRLNGVSCLPRGGGASSWQSTVRS